MSKVTDLGEWKSKRPEVVWECSCGCQKYYILNINGKLECSECGQVVYVGSPDEEEAE